LKGRIKKTDKGWVVLYTECVPKMIVTEWNKSLPLHPDDIKQINADAQIFDNIEARIKSYPDVEFDIVKEYIDSHTNQVQSYAKLIPETIELEKLSPSSQTEISDDQAMKLIQDMNKQPMRFHCVPKEISDEEILDAAREAVYEDIEVSVGSFELGAQWYREQLKKK
jgi:hypothetical protein